MSNNNLGCLPVINSLTEGHIRDLFENVGQEAEPGLNRQDTAYAFSDESNRSQTDATRAKASQVPPGTEAGLSFIPSFVPSSTPLGISTTSPSMGHAQNDLGAPESNSFRVRYDPYFPRSQVNPTSACCAMDILGGGVVYEPNTFTVIPLPPPFGSEVNTPQFGH